MRSYEIRYMDGQSMPYKTFCAANDAEFYQQLGEWEKKTGHTHVRDTLRCRISERYSVQEPPSVCRQTPAEERSLHS